MSTPATKLNWNELSPVDASSAEANAAAARQQLEAAQGNVDRTLKKAASAGYGVKLDWNELTPTNVAPSTPSGSKAIAESASPSYHLERTDTGTMRKVLNKPRQEVRFEKGADYDKVFPPEKAATRFDAIGQIGDAVVDFTSGLAHKMGLPTVAGIKQDVADTASGGFLSKLWDATKAIPEAQGNELIAAYNEWEKAGAGDHVPLTAIRHALGGIVPIIGPALSRSGGELEQGNIKEASQDFLAAALPIIAPVLFKSARGLVAKGVPPEQAIMQAADEHLSPLVTERMKSTLGGELQQPIPVEGALGTGARPRVLAHHSRFQPREVTGEFKEGVPVEYHETKIQPLTQLPDVGSNYREPLSRFSPTVFHDASVSKAEGLLPTSNTMTSTGEMYLSNTPNLARGQGGSSGVLLEFDAGKLQGQVNRKPGWEIAYQNGEAEFVARHNKQVTYQDALRSVTIKPEMLGNKGKTLRLSGALNRLEAWGWTKEVRSDGTLIYHRPPVEYHEAKSTPVEGLPQPPQSGFTRFYRADEVGAKGPQGANWVADPEYVSRKYGAGQMGSESIHYIDVPTGDLQAEFGDVPHQIVNKNLEAMGIKPEAKLYRRTELPPRTTGIANAVTTAVQPDNMPAPLVSWADYQARRAAGESHEQIYPQSEPVNADAQPSLSPEVQVPTSEAPRTTGIANTVTTAERADRGLSPIEHELTRSFPESHAGGIQMVDADPAAFRATVADWARNPRPLDDFQDAALVYDRMKLQNEHQALMDKYDAATDPAVKTQIRASLEGNETQTAVNEEAAVRTGTANGRGLNARKMMIAEDYSLSRLIQRARVATDKPVSEPVRAQLTDIAAKIKKANGALDAVTENGAKAAANDVIENLKTQEAKTIRKNNRAIAKVDLAAEWNALGKEAAALAGRLSSNPLFDPKLYDIVGRMARNRIRAGVVTAADIVDAVHAYLIRSGMANLTVREVQEAISGYGKPPKTLTSAQQAAADITKQLNVARRELKAQLKADDVLTGKVESPETIRRRATIKAQTTRLTKRIADLQAQVDSGVIKPTVGRTTLPTDPAIQKLQVELKTLQKQADRIVKRTEWDQKKWWQKALAYTAAGERAGILSGPGTIGKIGGAIAQNLALTPATELAGSGLKHVFPETFAAAPRHGTGFTLEAEAARMKGLVKGTKEIPQVLMTGDTPTTLLLGREHYPTIPTKIGNALEVPGRSHAAMKNIPKTGEYEASLVHNRNWAVRQGLDPNDPVVDLVLKKRALADGEESVLMGKGKLKEAIGKIDQGWSDEAKDIGRIAVPIRGVPAEFVKQIGEYMFGTIRGALRVLKSRDPVRWENYYSKPENADLTARLLKRGTVGIMTNVAIGAAAALGYKILGGYHQEGEHPGKPSEKGKVPNALEKLPGFENAKIGDMEISRRYLHGPDAATAQATATFTREIELAKQRGEGKGRGLSQGFASSLRGVIQGIPVADQYVKIYEASESGKKMENALGQLVVNLIEPQLLQQVARGTDSEIRKPQGIKEALKAGIPGLRKSVTTAEGAKELSEVQAMKTRYRNAGAPLPSDAELLQRVRARGVHP